MGGLIRDYIVFMVNTYCGAHARTHVRTHKHAFIPQVAALKAFISATCTQDKWLWLCWGVRSGEIYVHVCMFEIRSLLRLCTCAKDAFENLLNTHKFYGQLRPTLHLRYIKCLCWSVMHYRKRNMATNLRVMSSELETFKIIGFFSPFHDNHLQTLMSLVLLFPGWSDHSA